MASAAHRRLFAAAEERFDAGLAVALVLLALEHTKAENQPAGTEHAVGKGQKMAHRMSETSRFPLSNRCAILPVSAGAPERRA
jgi:hypothetical protein